MDTCACQPPGTDSRRGFLKKLWAVGISAVVALVPVAAGVAVLLDPLRRKARATGFIRVTTLDALPADGVPRKFPVLASRIDAWNTTEAAIGAVYLRRAGDVVLAFNVVCPHLGCFVDYLAARNGFLCPCHNSSFTVEGKIADPKSPAPRGMDSLAVEVRNNHEVWVEFQNFQTGQPEKIPVT